MKKDESIASYEEMTVAITNATQVIVAQSIELVALKKELAELKERAENLAKENQSLAQKEKNARFRVADLERDHIATTKAVRQKAVAYVNEQGNVVLIGQVAFKNVSYISGRDRLINDSWKPLGIIPKIEVVEE